MRDMRHNLLFIFGLLAAILWFGASGPDAPEISFCLPGNYHGEDIDRRGEAGWWVVCADTLLLPAVLTVRPVHDPMLDAPGEQTGVEISAANCPAAMVLIQDLPGASERTLTTAVVAETTGETSLNFAGSKFSLQSEPVGENGFRLVLADSLHRQILYETPHTDEGNWRVVWGGDLDGDRRLDLVLLATHKYSVGLYHLFLSGEAGEGQLLKRVATFRFTS